MDSDGNGLQPVNFSDPDQRFYIMNYAANTAPKLSKDLAVSGLESRVVLGNGLTAVNLTLVTGKSIIRGVIDVANNATLTINVPVFPALGNLSINSTVVLSKNAPTDLTQGVTFGNLILNSDKKNRLTKKITVKGKLDLIGGKLDLSDADLELDYGASVINATAVNYVEISSKGRLRQGIRAGAAEALLPVGRATYNPVKIKLAAGSQNDFFSVSILEKVYALYTNDVPDLKTPILSDAVNKTWLVSEDVKGGSNISLSLSWSLTDVLTGFNPANCHIKHYENGAWDNYTAGTAILSGTTYSVTRTDITTFSPFTASSASSGSTEANWGPLTLLPVELLYFAVKETDKNVVKLNWATVSEKDNDFFEVERSADGKNFVSIAKIKGAGNTNSRADYSFTDNNPLTATSYYRLRQVDLDESFEYSPVRSVSLKAWRSLVISFYPNPAQGSSVSLQLQGLNQGEDASLLITDMMGRSALQQQLQPGVVNIIPTVGLPSGTYLVNVAGREGTQTQKLIIR